MPCVALSRLLALLALLALLPPALASGACSVSCCLHMANAKAVRMHGLYFCSSTGILTWLPADVVLVVAPKHRSDSAST
jgi:hypothetical protein